QPHRRPRLPSARRGRLRRRDDRGRRIRGRGRRAHTRRARGLRRHHRRPEPRSRRCGRGPERTSVTGAFRLGRRAIGGGAACFVIAEAGVNHNGDPALAARLVDVAADAGADAVKFQTFRSEALVSRRAAKAAYQVETTGADESQLDMLRRLELPVAAHRTLLERCARRSIMFLSSSFDEGSADALEALGVAGFKIPSGEITNLPFLEHLAAKKRPVILSTGMSTLEEVEAAMAVFRRHAVPAALRVRVSRAGEPK